MNLLILIAADLAAIAVLTFGLYLRRHRRRDLVVSYVGMNVGVFAVATMLAGSTAGIGLGLGLFGVLSIIRLRSTELAQHEVAYYFSALAIGLIAGLGSEPLWLPLALLALILGVMAAVDHSRVLSAYRHQNVVLDQGIADEALLYRRLAEVLGGRIHSATVLELDLVNDRTIVEVRYEAGRRSAGTGEVAPRHTAALQEAGLPGEPPAGTVTAAAAVPATSPASVPSGAAVSSGAVPAVS
ncbi:DUF4956 domain-containing protein [Arthrobacter sp. zg-Y1143]|uniref:DUF4956 domain-containing protein n=1 Tax=Arthrobacter sp. zg-Y1143 TaxID=3049065 RepID=UPI0024C24839|nr:DUF4956 domain-containing protein [Arthrobacter sp. zg-Y1143]MDK1326344.1 DUF4956 domain-containing protein [Arthrobacter sp. zg-Y1143]